LVRSFIHRFGIVLLCALFALVACADSGGGSRRSGAKRVGVTLLTREHEFYRELEAGLRDAAQKAGYEVRGEARSRLIDDWRPLSGATIYDAQGPPDCAAGLCAVSHFQQNGPARPVRLRRV